MIRINVISYIGIVNTALYKYIDSYPIQYVDNKIFINLTRTTTDVLTYLILDEIKSMYYAYRPNLLLNSCNTTDNWRSKNEDNENINISKYKLIDDSILIEESKFYAFLDRVFINAPKFLAKEGNVYKRFDIKLIHNSDIDAIDVKFICNTYYDNVSFINFDNYNYNIIEDGNSEFYHKGNIPDFIIDRVRLIFLE